MQKIEETENSTTPELITTEHLAMEILKHEEEKSNAKNIALVVLGTVSAALTVAIVIITIWLTHINHQNDKEWRDLFDSYDFISQDGEGFNNVNSGTQGNLDNSSEE